MSNYRIYDTNGNEIRVVGMQNKCDVTIIEESYYRTLKFNEFKINIYLKYLMIKFFLLDVIHYESFINYFQELQKRVLFLKYISKKEFKKIMNLPVDIDNV